MLRTLMVVAWVLIGGALAMIAVNYAYGAPFVVADIPAATCNQCVWTAGPAGFAGTSAVVVDTVRGKPAFGNRICMRDIANAIVGTNNVNVSCRDTTSVWEDSESVPFSFARPLPPLKPEDTRITK